MAEKTRLQKFHVCADCYSLNCGCSGSHICYQRIELEFEVCNCCNNIVEDGDPADTEFNREQLKTKE